jgi:hypothetical protein
MRVLLHDAQEEYRYSGVSFPSVDSHRFGAIDAWPKISNLAEKCRPLGSYYCHCLAPLFSVACRAINFMISLLCPGNISVACASSVVEKFHTFNLDVEDWLRRGYRPKFVPFKRDIDIFSTMYLAT